MRTTTLALLALCSCCDPTTAPALVGAAPPVVAADQDAPVVQPDLLPAADLGQHQQADLVVAPDLVRAADLVVAPDLVVQADLVAPPADLLPPQDLRQCIAAGKVCGKASDCCGGLPCSAVNQVQLCCHATAGAPCTQVADCCQAIPGAPMTCAGGRCCIFAGGKLNCGGGG